MSRLVPVAALLMGTATGRAQQGVSDGQWRHSNGDTGATRYSSLDQITAENVGSLQIAWRWNSANFGPTPEFKNETTPLMLDGGLCFTAGFGGT
jgi:quinoprotein glucose dehydrogenase